MPFFMELNTSLISESQKLKEDLVRARELWIQSLPLANQVSQPAEPEMSQPNEAAGK